MDRNNKDEVPGFGQTLRRTMVAALAVLGVATINPASAQQGFRGGIEEALGSLFTSDALTPAERLPFNIAREARDTTDRLRLWNEVANMTTAIDHTPVAPGETRVFGEQLGPTRASRAMAITHIAIFDAVNAKANRYRSYTGLPRVNGDVSLDEAIAYAAHDTLVALYPSQSPRLDALLAQDNGRIRGTPLAKTKGIALGKSAAAAIIALRANDHSNQPEPKIGINFFFSNDVGKWRQDPVAQQPIALGALWNQVTPFVMQSASQFRAPPPPALDSPEYAAAFNEVKQEGGDRVHTPTDRTVAETFKGIFWAYDGTPSLCAPPRLYNQIAAAIAVQQGTTNVVELARLMALVNVAMADAGISAWDSKFFYQFWRPVTAIRESDAGTGPTGLGDGNAATVGDPNFIPLGAPASNLHGPNFTPPFPAYPSGHAVFGGAIFQVLRNFYGSDLPFWFVSDEYDGVTKGNDGKTRPFIPRYFRSMSQAEEENGQSRIYLGIHFKFDKVNGIAEGRQVGDYIFQNTFLPN